MRGTVSFHPVDPAVFQTVLDPLLAGRPADPSALLDSACRLHRIAVGTTRYRRAVQSALEEAAPPPLPTEGPLWLRIKARFDQFDHRPDPLARRLSQRVDADLHFFGRPFFVTEGSAEAVAGVIDAYLTAAGPSTLEVVALEQLVRLDADAARLLGPTIEVRSSSDLPYRSRLATASKRLADLARKVRRDPAAIAGGWAPRDDAAAAAEIAWRAVYLYARSVPFWIARDVDGLDTICRIARVPTPVFLVPPFELFEASLQSIPSLRPALRVDMDGPRAVGAYVPPREIFALLDFLHTHGTRIIQAAARQGEGTACATLLHKIRECACFASRHGMGYLEAAGIDRVEDDWDAERGEEGAGLARLLTDEVGADAPVAAGA